MTCRSPRQQHRALEALKANSVGGIGSLTRAIELDPNFATAYDALGVTHFTLGENGLASQNIQKAFELRAMMWPVCIRES